MATLVISYSRADQTQVRAVVSLLQGALRDIEKAVFWDGQLEPGDPWFEQLKAHIDATPQLFVFWCDHACRSDQVRREFLYALGQHKRVVPVLLDDTPLAAELAPIHGIDLRGAIQHDRAPLPRMRAKGLRFNVVAAAIVVAALMILSLPVFLSRQTPALSNPDPITTPLPLPPPPADSGATVRTAVYIAASASVLASGMVAWRKRRRRKLREFVVTEFARHVDEGAG